MTEQVQVEISGELLEDVHSAVASGQYASSSEVALEALREWQERRDEDVDWSQVLQAWDVSVAKNGPGHDPEEVFARLRARYAEPDPTGKQA